MTRFRIAAAAVAALILWNAPAAQASFQVRYEFNGNSAAPTTVTSTPSGAVDAFDATAASLGQVAPVPLNDRGGFRNDQAQFGPRTNTTVDTTRFFEIQVLANTGYLLESLTLTFDAYVYNTADVNGDGFIHVRSSQDGFTTNLSPTPLLVATTSTSNLITVDLSGLDLTDTLVLRFYTTNDTNDPTNNVRSQIAIDNIQVNGNVTIVPAPPALLLGLIGVPALGAALRLRRRTVATA